MPRRHRHVNRVGARHEARIDHIIRESVDGYFVARMTDGRVRVGLKSLQATTARTPEFLLLGEMAGELTDQEFHDACCAAAGIAACPCPRCENEP